jgi:hypothetical protein
MACVCAHITSLNMANAPAPVASSLLQRYTRHQVYASATAIGKTWFSWLADHKTCTEAAQILQQMDAFFKATTLPATHVSAGAQQVQPPARRYKQGAKALKGRARSSTENHHPNKRVKPGAAQL